MERLATYTRKSRPGPAAEYPWATWFDGGTYRLTKGRDFKCSLASMVDLIRKTAKTMKARGELDADFTFSVFTEPPKSCVIQPTQPTPSKPRKRPTTRSAARTGPKTKSGNGRKTR